MPSIFTLSGSSGGGGKRKAKRRRETLGANVHPRGADELKLTMDNEGRIYKRLVGLQTQAVRKACREGKFDRDAVAQLFMPLVAQEAKRYRRDFSEDNIITPSAQREVAYEYANELRVAVNLCRRAPAASCSGLPRDVIELVRVGCPIPTGGFAGAGKKKRRRR